MRRFFVICLILLLSHQVFAIAIAAPAVQIADAQQNDLSLEKRTASHLSVDCATACDIDPDEPPAGADTHDSVSPDAILQFTIFPDHAVSPVGMRHSGQCAGRLFKPPRAQ